MKLFHFPLFLEKMASLSPRQKVNNHFQTKKKPQRTKDQTQKKNTQPKPNSNFKSPFLKRWEKAFDIL